jgi:hypothetical protein
MAFVSPARGHSTLADPLAAASLASKPEEIPMSVVGEMRAPSIQRER